MVLVPLPPPLPLVPLPPAAPSAPLSPRQMQQGLDAPMTAWGGPAQGREGAPHPRAHTQVGACKRLGHGHVHVQYRGAKQPHGDAHTFHTRQTCPRAQARAPTPRQPRPTPAAHAQTPLRRERHTRSTCGSWLRAPPLHAPPGPPPPCTLDTATRPQASWTGAGSGIACGSRLRVRRQASLLIWDTAVACRPVMCRALHLDERHLQQMRDTITGLNRDKHSRLFVSVCRAVHPDE
jgi:hypothetical protein